MLEDGPRQMIAVIGFPNVVDVIVRIVFKKRDWLVQRPALVAFQIAQVVDIQLFVEYTFCATRVSEPCFAAIPTLIRSASQTTRDTLAITEITEIRHFFAFQQTI